MSIGKTSKFTQKFNHKKIYLIGNVRLITKLLSLERLILPFSRKI